MIEVLRRFLGPAQILEKEDVVVGSDFDLETIGGEKRNLWVVEKLELVAGNFKGEGAVLEIKGPREAWLSLHHIDGGLNFVCHFWTNGGLTAGKGEHPYPGTNRFNWQIGKGKNFVTLDVDTGCLIAFDLGTMRQVRLRLKESQKTDG